jgi:hypothetical protein
MQSVPIDTKLCDKVCQSLAAVWWFSPVSTNKTDRSDITDMLLKVALNTINQTNQVNKKRTNELSILT